MRTVAVILALFLAGLLLVQVPSCGGGTASFQPFPATIQGAGDEVASSEGFTLRRHTSYVEYGDDGDLSLNVVPDGDGVLVSVASDSTDLRQAFVSIQYDPRRYHPVEGASQAWRGGEEVLALLVLDQPGAVHYGGMLARPQERMGISGRVELLRVRFARGRMQPRRASTAPDTSFSIVPDLTLNEATGEITFSYYNAGDYDQNTEVNISDITPLGVNLGASSPGGFPPETALSAIDGDANGALTISDLTPIGANFFNSISGWNAYAGSAADHAAADNGSAIVIASLEDDNFNTSHLTPQNTTDRRTATFTTTNTAYVGLEMFWIRPVDNGEEGIASDPFPLGVDRTPPEWTDPDNPGIIAVAPHDGSATVYWGEATDAQSSPVVYTIYYNEGTDVSFDIAQTLEVPASEPFDEFESAEVTGLTNGTEYAFAVRAKDSAAEPNEELNTQTELATPDLLVDVPGSLSADQQFTSPCIIPDGSTTTVTNSPNLVFDRDLIIDGTLHGQDGDLCIEVFGDLIVNGTITVDGDDADRPDDSEWQSIKIICHGNYFFNSTSVVGGEANIYIVDDASLITSTQSIYDDSETDSNQGQYPVNLMPEDESGTSSVSSVPLPVATRGASFVPGAPFCRGFISGNWGVIPTPPKGVKRVVLAVQSSKGTMTLQNFTVTGPKGRKGTNDNGCTAVGGKGERAFTCRVHASKRVTFNNVTINLGDGGDGGDATTPPCCPASATGGMGGKSGQFRATAGSEIKILGLFTLNPGKGGSGGAATATGQDGNTGCPCTDGCDATAIGGEGASESKKLSARGNVNGLANFVLGVLQGGDGGTATATAGNGGTTTCPCSDGCMGGHATATGGKGGDATCTNAAGVAGGGATGGNGGTATATGGTGGDGSPCDKFNPGGNGGAGGDATATGGTGGGATGNGPLTTGADGAANAIGGNGGNGQEGCLGGSGGPGGAATATGNPANQANGNAGSNGPDRCFIFFCIDIPSLVPDPSLPGPIPDGHSGTAVILDESLQQVGSIPFVWDIRVGSQVNWNTVNQTLNFNSGDILAEPALRLDYSQIQWDIPQPNVVGFQTGILGAQGPSTSPGRMELRNATEDVLHFEPIPSIPPSPEPVPIELIALDLTGVTTYRQSCTPLCSVVVQTIYIIDP